MCTPLAILISIASAIRSPTMVSDVSAVLLYHYSCGSAAKESLRCSLRHSQLGAHGIAVRC
eukprot:COSAG03_NODE_588_length_6843_cov_12.500297_1_plen_61_part_00